MRIGTIFWMLMILWLVFGILIWFLPAWHVYAPWGSVVLVWILFALLGWQVFGPAIQR
jgi:hypothetical protein